MEIQVNDMVTHQSLQIISQGKPYQVNEIIEDRNLAKVSFEDIIFWVDTEGLKRSEL